uniref:Uncharacterized protein n=1 Tax=Panagrolaimus davidi TaxID=227884 RepID=A0A914QAG3_9BILA
MNNLQMTLSPVMNVQHTFLHPRAQQFSLKYPVMKYILNNPTGNAWKKLIQTCKYFFQKYPIIPICSVETYDEAEWSRWKADKEVLDLSKCFQNLWLYDRLSVKHVHVYFSNKQKILSNLVSKIEKCDFRKISICSQTLLLEEYQMLTSSSITGLQIHLKRCTIIYSDGSEVPIDKLIERIYNVTNFDIYCNQCTKMFEGDAVVKMAQILPTLKNMCCFTLENLTKAFDFALITDFLLKNDIINISLDYAKFRPCEYYKTLLTKFLSELFANPPKKIPDLPFLIFFNGGCEYRKMIKLQSHQRCQLH